MQNMSLHCPRKVWCSMCMQQEQRRHHRRTLPPDPDTQGHTHAIRDCHANKTLHCLHNVWCSMCMQQEQRRRTAGP